MSKSRQELFAQSGVESRRLWDEAIAAAYIKIEQAEQRIVKLKSAIETFERLRDKGEPFFDGEANEGEASPRL